VADTKEKRPSDPGARPERSEGAPPRGKPDKEKQPKKDKGGKGGGKPAAEAAPRAPAPPAEPAPRARLLDYYEQTVCPRLTQQFGLLNRHQLPRLAKIVLNVGMGKQQKTPKALETAAVELGQITGQKAVITRAKKSIANFNLRQGVSIGAMVTLRGARMWEFLDRFINVVVPRIRDFRGLSPRSFDGRGSYSIGVKEQMIFPEIDYDKVDSIHGMDITFVTTAGRDDLAHALLRELGMPFRGETPVTVG
jgi:large subunit ribosomal protein L5